MHLDSLSVIDLAQDVLRCKMKSALVARHSERGRHIQALGRWQKAIAALVNPVGQQRQRFRDCVPPLSLNDVIYISNFTLLNVYRAKIFVVYELLEMPPFPLKPGTHFLIITRINLIPMDLAPVYDEAVSLNLNEARPIFGDKPRTRYIGI